MQLQNKKAHCKNNSKCAVQLEKAANRIAEHLMKKQYDDAKVRPDALARFAGIFQAKTAECIVCALQQMLQQALCGIFF